MLKVNEEKLLHDYRILAAKKHDNLALIEKDAKAYAVAHNYNEAQTAELVICITKLQNNGLSAEESAKLEILADYIEEVAETVDESGLAESAEKGPETVADPTLRVNVV